MQVTRITNLSNPGFRIVPDVAAPTERRAAIASR